MKKHLTRIWGTNLTFRKATHKNSLLTNPEIQQDHNKQF